MGDSDELAQLRAELAETREQLGKARDDLERTSRTLEIVLHQMPAVYWLVDHDLTIVSAGGAIEKVLGYKPGRWVGSSLRTVQATEGGSSDTVEPHLRALTGELVTYTNVYRDKHMAVTIGPYRRNDQIAGAIGTAIDITAFRVLEQRMVDAQRAESLGVLAGGLAHDFNNLLVAIIGNADLGLRDIPPNAPGRASLDNIRAAGLRAAELTDQLLAYAGRGGVSTTRVGARGVVDELLRISAPTMPTNVTVAVEIPAGLAVRADAAQVRQVVMNLIGNARDALGARGGTITVTGRTVRRAGQPEAGDVITPTAGAFVELSFADTGPGMDAETQRHIFEPFYTTKASGHGLGLAAVLGIVRAHGGGLRLLSEPGHGARFDVLWPAASTPVEQPVVTHPDARTVLVIDDEDLVRDVVARMIEDLGYSAVTAPDGATGLEIALNQSVDAVLVDLTMPLMSGADVVAALRAQRPALPIVLCSGYDRDRRGPIAADAYLPKPFRIEALEATLHKVLPVVRS